MNATANIKTFHDAKGNTIKVEGLIPIFSRKRTDNSKYWVIYSPHLNTFGQSNESEKKAFADFERAIKVFFDIHSKRGTIEKALLTFGWTKVENTLIKPKLGNSPVTVVTGQFNLETMAMAA